MLLSHWEGKLMTRTDMQEWVRRLLLSPAVVEARPWSGSVSSYRQFILFSFIHDMPLILTADASTSLDIYKMLVRFVLVQVALCFSLE